MWALRLDSVGRLEGRKIYSERLGNLEPVFANLASQKGMNRSPLRGVAKATIQWKLYCLVHNLEKIAGNLKQLN